MRTEICLLLLIVVCVVIPITYASIRVTLSMKRQTEKLQKSREYIQHMRGITQEEAAIVESLEQKSIKVFQQFE